MFLPVNTKLPQTAAVLYLDDLSYAIAEGEDIEKVKASLADAMQDQGTLEVRIMTPGSPATLAIVRPSSARIAYVDPYLLSPEVGKPIPHKD